MMSDTSSSIAYPNRWERAFLRLPIALYRLGLGGLLNAAGLLMLTTHETAGGAPRVTAIDYRQHGSAVYLVSAWGTRPTWVQNLLANAAVTVQRGGWVTRARAEIITDHGEALRALYLFRRRAPFLYDPILARLANREQINGRTLPQIRDAITVIRLTPAPDAISPAPLATDRVWVLPAAFATSALMFAVFALVNRRRS